jgi:F0F1-type ATP synthase beta subunit
LSKSSSILAKIKYGLWLWIPPMVSFVEMESIRYWRTYIRSVGPETLGRLINVIGQPIDNKGPIYTQKRYPIHRKLPKFKSLSTSTEMLETGIKVIDLLEPYSKGG